jgi:heparosan-N-sulfate-glucuronate 5-epimerase
MTTTILGEYMKDASPGVSWAAHKANWSGAVDSNGIPLHDLGGVRLSGVTYHPVVITQYALAHWNRAQNGNADSERTFLRCARWLEENATEEPGGRFLTWLYTYRLRTPPMSAPWISGMAQGKALSVLARAFQTTASPRTADVARRAAKGFLYTVSDGGLITRDRAESCFIEEFAALPPIHVLNGCLSGFVGLFEHDQLFPDPSVAAVLTACIAGVEKLLPAFDTGYWSKYCLGMRWRISPVHYHRVHIKQLRYLGNLLRRQTFLDRATLWESYERSRVNRARQRVVEWLQLNANRTMTVLRLNLLKYRDVKGWDT